MAKTNYQSRLADYNREELAAKKSFLKSTGKKIATGFKETTEYKRIQRNKKQFSYRHKRKKLKVELKSKNWINSFPLVTHQIYHLVLGYNDKISRAIRTAFRDIKRLASNRRAVVEISYPDGSKGLCENFVKVDTSFNQLYMMGLEEQQRTGNSDAMYISADQTEGKEGFYFIVNAYFDKAQ